jgi:hypothetical protein
MIRYPPSRACKRLSRAKLYIHQIAGRSCRSSGAPRLHSINLTAGVLRSDPLAFARSSSIAKEIELPFIRISFRVLAEMTLNLYSWVPPLLQVWFSLRDCAAIVISSLRREIFSSHVAENARSLALLEMTGMGHSCIATQALKGP